ncbi:response regulator [Hydrogenophaga sp.]|uniref:response regulator n=1 Tax=Hydrogenophaga sp. TaxID=1904254 RepID=UPI00271BE0F1|nr:response regulator [Hydrogenophaga sp.]MDO8904966.1 response regulator [Hydrogenophaga sp.]
MAAAYSVALVGFAQSESATFESFFSLAARRPPAYAVQDEVSDAQILIVNADNQQALNLVQFAELPGRVLLLGNSDGGTGWPLQRKPVKLVAVLAALDALVGVRPPSPKVAPASTDPTSSLLQGLDESMRRVGQRAPATSARAEAHHAMAPAVKSGRRSVDSEFPPTRPMQRETSAAAPPAMAPRSSTRQGVVRLTDFGGLDEMPSPPSNPVTRSGRATKSAPGTEKASVPDVPRGDMLLVAESLVEGRILHKRFKKYGLNIDWSREAKQALVMMQNHAYRLVVIDRLNGDPDALQVCRVAKQKKGPKGAPVVFMFAPTAGSMDRVKAGLAGSDAYLSRSVGEADLYRTLAQHRLVSLDGFAPTNIG